jgi:hypothetical protein
MLCGNMAQIPQEVQAGTSVFQYLAAAPLLGLLIVYAKGFFKILWKARGKAKKAE